MEWQLREGVQDVLLWLRNTGWGQVQYPPARH